MTQENRAGHWQTCACGKRGYASRKAARDAQRQNRRLRGLDVYPCHWEGQGHLFHLGNLPYQVKRGVIGRDAIPPTIARAPRPQPHEPKRRE